MPVDSAFPLLNTWHSAASKHMLSAQAVSDHVAEAQSAAAYINETPGLAKESPGQQGQVSWKWDILRPVVAGPQPVNIQDPGTSVEAGGL